MYLSFLPDKRENKVQKIKAMLYSSCIKNTKCSGKTLLKRCGFYFMYVSQIFYVRTGNILQRIFTSITEVSMLNSICKMLKYKIVCGKKILK